MNKPAIHKLLRMKRLSLLALAGAAASAPAYGKLSFETKVIEDVIPHDAKAYPFAFAFENTGELLFRSTGLSRARLVYEDPKTNALYLNILNE